MVDFETPVKLISVDEFRQITDNPENSEKRLELIEGEIFEMSRPGAKHGYFTILLGARFVLHVEQHNLGYVTSDSGYIIAHNPEGRDTVFGPDVAYIAKDRLPGGVPDGWIEGAPDLAVEVVSPNDVFLEVEDKAEKYLSAGTRLVWIFVPEFKRVYVHRQDKIEVLGINDTLDAGDILPGFMLPLRAVFSASDE